MHVQKNNPIRTRGTCVYKGPTLWRSYAQIEDQSYEHTMHIQSSILWTLHVATHVRVLCHVGGRTIYIRKPRPACTKKSCYKEYFGNNAGEKLSEWYRSSLHKHSKMHTVKWNRFSTCDKVWCESVSSSSDWFIVCNMYCT